MKHPAAEKTVIIRQDAGATHQYVDVWFDVEKTFGKKRFKAKIWYDGHLYRGLVAKYAGSYWLMMNKEIRDMVGKKAGEKVHVRVEEDIEERVVTVPDVLQHALDRHPTAKRAFEKLSYTHRKEYVNWINEAKKTETRDARVEKCLQMLLGKVK